MDGVHDIDTLMGHMGDFGKYQAWQFTLHILSAVTAGLNMLSLVTVAAIPDHRCQIPDEEDLTFANHSLLEQFIPRLQNGNFDNCHLFNSTSNETYTCSKWIYDDTYYTSSRAIEWNFVCDRRWMGAVAQSMYMFGVFTGAVTLGNMADKYGRKPVFCWSAILQLILGVGVAFTPNYYSFILIRYLYGIFGSAGSYIPGFVLTMELVGPSKRSMCGISFQAAFAFGIMLVAAWGSFIKDRFLLQIIYGCHALVLMGHFWLMDESPRWLWANGSKQESMTIIRRALKMNNSPVNIDTCELSSKTSVDKNDDNQPKEAGMLDLFRSPRLRKMTLNVCLAWFANSLVYYGLSLSTGNLKGNPYLILFVMGMVELPSYVITVYIMDRLGRRSITSFNMIVGGLCCIIAANLALGSSSSTWFVFIGKFLIASSFAVIYNYSAELFPTVIRNSAMGLGSMCARTSGALTPLIILFDSFNPKLPSTIFAVIALLSGFLCLFLPETLNKAMPQSIEDGENFGVNDTCFTTCLGGGKKEEPSATSRELEPLKT